MTLLNITKKPLTVLAAMACISFAQSSSALVAYSQNFETLDAENSFALGIVGGEGFVIYNTSYFGSTVLYSYGPFTAPNGGPGFSAIAAGEGGVDQGDQYLNIYSDYNNADHGNAAVTHVSSVFKEQTMVGDESGTWTFSFDAKAPFEGGIDTSQVSARAFIKTIDPNNNYALTNEIFIDMTDVSNTDWASFSMDFTILDGAALTGQLLQFGFETTGGNYADSGIYYDNINFTSEVPVPAAAWLFGSAILGLAGIGRKRGH